MIMGSAKIKEITWGLTTLLVGLLAMVMGVPVPLVLVLLGGLAIALMFHKGLILDFFAPWIIFPTVWLGAALLSGIAITEMQGEWTSEVWIYMILAPLSFALPAFAHFVKERRWPKPGPLQLDWDGKRLIIVLGSLFLLCLAALSFEYYQLGTIPLFSPEIELLRFEVMQNGYIHTFAVSFKTVLMVSLVYLMADPGMPRRRRWQLHAIITSSCLALITLGSRGQILIPLAVTVIAYHYLRRSFSLKRIMLLGFCGFSLVSLMAFFRFYLLFGDSYIQSLEDVGFPRWSALAAPGYLSFSYNFEVFRKLVDTIPTLADFQLGRFVFYPVYTLLPGPQESLGEFQNYLWNVDFRGELTATFLGTLYADFGVVGIMLGSMIIGGVALYLYRRLAEARTPVNVLLYSYFTFALIFSTYTYPYSFSFFWEIGLFLLINRLARRRKEVTA